jgi:hypothetical protein
LVAFWETAGLQCRYSAQVRHTSSAPNEIGSQCCDRIVNSNWATNLAFMPLVRLLFRILLADVKKVSCDYSAILLEESLALYQVYYRVSVYSIVG